MALAIEVRDEECDTDVSIAQKNVLFGSKISTRLVHFYDLLVYPWCPCLMPERSIHEPKSKNLSYRRLLYRLHQPGLCGYEPEQQFQGGKRPNALDLCLACQCGAKSWRKITTRVSSRHINCTSLSKFDNTQGHCQAQFTYNLGD